MENLTSLSNEQLLAHLPVVCGRERQATAEVIVYLAEVDRRKLYLREACSSLFSFCVERLGYSEEAALKRMRVARLYRTLPQVLDELKSGAVHLTGLFLLSGHLTEANATPLLAEARGKTRRQLELVIARWFPKPDVLPSITPLGAPSACPGTGAAAGAALTCPGTGELVAAGMLDGADRDARGTVGGTACPGTGAAPEAALTCPGMGELVATGMSDGADRDARGTVGGTACPGTGAAPEAALTCPGAGESSGLGGTRDRTQPLSAQSYRVEFTASAELHAKLEQAQNLLGHAVGPGALGEIFERALDALIAKETKRRQGVASKKPRKDRPVKEGSRHVPVGVAREVWNRDEYQCTFVDAHGRRCSEKRYVTLEHIDPHARGGPPSAENLCLLCGPHNQDAARHEFGEEHIRRKRREAEAFSKSAAALVGLGFKRKEARAAMDALRARGAKAEVEELLRRACALLCPPNQVSRRAKPDSAGARGPTEA